MLQHRRAFGAREVAAQQPDKPAGVRRVEDRGQRVSRYGAHRRQGGRHPWPELPDSEARRVGEQLVVLVLEHVLAFDELEGLVGREAAARPLVLGGAQKFERPPFRKRPHGSRRIPIMLQRRVAQQRLRSARS